MSRTWKAEKRRDQNPYRSPSWWRRMGNRLYRARCRQRMREGRFEFPPPRKNKRGWYW